MHGKNEQFLPIEILFLIIKLKSNIEDTSGGSGDHRTSKYNHGFEEESSSTHKPLRTYGIRAEEVFPETIGGIEYAYATVDEVAKLSVSFQYRNWKEIEPVFNDF